MKGCPKKTGVKHLKVTWKMPWSICTLLLPTCENRCASGSSFRFIHGHCRLATSRVALLVLQSHLRGSGSDFDKAETFYPKGIITSGSHPDPAWGHLSPSVYSGSDFLQILTADCGVESVELKTSIYGSVTEQRQKQQWRRGAQFGVTLLSCW